MNRSQLRKQNAEWMTAIRAALPNTIDAIRLARRCLLALGLGDSFERAKNIVRDVAERQPWTLPKRR